MAATAPTNPGSPREPEAAGFTLRQAEAQATALKDMLEHGIATKQDLSEMELRLKHDLILRLGGMVVACTGILLVLLPMVIR